MRIFKSLIVLIAMNLLAVVSVHLLGGTPDEMMLHLVTALCAILYAEYLFDGKR